MFIRIPRQDAQELFDGILAGDGDIYGRMASSHPDARPNYPFGLEVAVRMLYESLKPESELYGKGREIADYFLAKDRFLGEGPLLETEEPEEEDQEEP